MIPSNSSYWVVPEDVKLHWAPLVDDLQRMASGHEGQEFTFSIIVRNGRVTDLVEPIYRQREPRGTAVTSTQARHWWSVIRRLQSVVNGRDCLIEVQISLDSGGNPASWTCPDVRYVEPKVKRDEG